MDSDKMTFADALKKGLCDFCDIETFIHEWHTGPSTKEIYEFLGMTQQQYFIYLREHEKGLKRIFRKGMRDE